MQKLTHSEAQDLIKKAWKMVVDYDLGQHGFGETLWHLLPKQVWHVENSQDILFYEQNPDIAIGKFYEFFVEDSDN